ncbi:MAG: hypothetical protein GF346_02715 [Candidatus Eisenbacteria bacterium]|nr:hypothetical protein [Candidatus Latescibacterota bacterium]MBD3301332.1 hypothetical protein [Candidatus Eisenbacteria bacterium]
MKSRRTLMAASLALMTLLLVLVVLQRSGADARPEPQRIEFRGGERFDGLLMEVREGSVLLQTAETCLILPPGEIASIGGEAIPSHGPATIDRVPRQQETYEELSPDGTIELRSRLRRENRRSSIISEVKWGIARHELELLDRYRVIDEFGNDLRYEILEDPSFDGKRIRVPLSRPVLPGEATDLTVVYRDTGAFRDEGGDWVYRNVGDYPDDRLVTRSVRVPAGAEIVAVTPEPIHRIAQERGELVIWRRYFRAGERQPWEIRYRL